MLSYFFWFPLFHLVSIALTATINFSAFFFYLHDGQMNLGTFGVAQTPHCSGVSGSSMPLSRSTSDSSSASQLSSLTFQLSMSSFQLSQFAVLEMLLSALYSYLSARKRSIFLIHHAFNIWVSLTKRSFADKAGGRGDLSYNLNAAAPSCWMFDQDALTFSSVFVMYHTAVICLISVHD